MRLEDLRKKIYQPEEEFKERLKRKSIFKKSEEIKKVPERWVEEEKKRKKPLFYLKNKKYLWSGVILLLLFLFGVGVMVWHGLTSFDEDKVELTLEGPKRVASGEEVKYFVKYRNKTRLKLVKIKLTFHYPTNSLVSGQQSLVQTFDLPDLLPGQTSKIELPVRIIGLKGESKKAWAELSYQPEKVKSSFTKQAEFVTTIFSVPLGVNFDLPEKLVSGQSFDFSLTYFNQTEVDFNDLEIRIEFPRGFDLDSAEPLPLSEKAIWRLDELKANEEGKIFLKGSIRGEEGETKSFKAQLGYLQENKFILYAEATAVLKISLPPLVVRQSIKDVSDRVVYPGETLLYEIEYQNTTDVGIKEVVITSYLEGSAIDFSSLDPGSGSFDGDRQAIVWKASNLPSLEYLSPGEKGKVNFRISVKNPLPIKNYQDKNFEIINTVKIDSNKRPLSLQDIQLGGEDKLTVKVVTQLDVKAKGYYYDDLMPGKGPLPPKVGEKTVYTIKWSLTNTANKLSQVKVEAFLPPHVKWEGNFSPAEEKITYSVDSGKLTWLVDELLPGTGILTPTKEVSFQVSITPTSAQKGSLVELISQTKASGYDEFVKKEIIDTSDLIETNLPDDLNVSFNQGLVVE